MARHRIQMNDEIALLGRNAALVLAGRKSRRISPEGRSDGGGRWYPSDAENSDYYTCVIRSPSRQWPYSYLKGACTRPHVIGLALDAPAFLAAHAEMAVAAGVTVADHDAGLMAKSVMKKLREEADEEDAEEAKVLAAAAAEEAEEDRREADAALLVGIADSLPSSPQSC